MTKIIIANWKMNKTYMESIDWCKKNKQELEEIALKTKNVITICPSFESISSISTIFKNKDLIKTGSQNCSNYLNGPYTGQVSVLSLKELNCEYCIVGHIEQRKYNCENDYSISQKARLLIKNKICPIICIGEQEENHQDNIVNVLLNQIKSILDSVKDLKDVQLYIAYEPGWAIGKELTNIDIFIKTLENIFFNIDMFINEKYNTHNNKKISAKLLYGGGVNDKNINILNQIPQISGYLIGSTSLDFQKFKKIILSLRD